MATKELPHNTEAEKAVLGSMLRSTSKVADGVARLEVGDFYEGNKNHRAIFSAILRLYTRGDPVDPQTVVNELINTKELEVAGGTDYLVELADSIITFENFDKYVDIVREQSVLREFLVTINNISNHYFTKEIENVGDFLSESEKEISKVTERRKIGDFQTSREVAGALATELQNLKSTTSDDEVTGTPTGFSRLNQLTHGFHKNELIILAARPGVGKTALSLNLAYNASSRGNIPVAYFSLEMPATMLFKRLVSQDAEVKFDSLITGFGLDKNNRLKLQQACQRLAAQKIYVDDTSGIKLLDLVAKCKKLKAKEPDLGLIVVDYIGLVTTSSKTKAESRQLEVQMISQTLKKLAMDLEVPIIGVAQLNRNVESRGGEPQLSDLRESGSIEQDADVVMMIHEQKLDESGNAKGKQAFNQKQEQVAQEARDKVANTNGDDTKLVTLFIRKNRAGRTGKVRMIFRKDYCKFEQVSDEANTQLDEIDEEVANYISTDDR